MSRMNHQKSRWMLLGWLGRAHQLLFLSAMWTFAEEDDKQCTWIKPFFTDSQSRKLMIARELINEVLQEIRGTET